MIELYWSVTLLRVIKSEHVHAKPKLKDMTGPAQSIRWKLAVNAEEKNKNKWKRK